MFIGATPFVHISSLNTVLDRCTATHIKSKLIQTKPPKEKGLILHMKLHIEPGLVIPSSSNDAGPGPKVPEVATGPAFGGHCVVRSFWSSATGVGGRLDEKRMV